MSKSKREINMDKKGNETCSDCEYAELQCPPILRCKITGKMIYLDNRACKRFKQYKEK
ncbi:MAG: hypothetical protein QXF82_01280 [Nitrososphaeria archaeon]